MKKENPSENKQSKTGVLHKLTHGKAKYFTTLLLICTLVMSGFGIRYMMTTRAGTSAADSNEVKIHTSGGQTVVFAKITSIYGNEVTYLVANEVEEAKEAGESGSSEEEATSEDFEIPEGSFEMPEGDFEMPEGDFEMPEGDFEIPEGGFEMPEGSFDLSGGEMPEGSFEMPEGDFDFSGEELSSGGFGMPSGDFEIPEGSFDFSGGEMPEGGFDFSGGEMPEGFGGSRGSQGGFGQGQSENASDRFTYDNTTYQVGDESVTAYIPVGTVVTTRLGTVTTFSRLAAGDYVAFVMEASDGENVIMSVYIVG